MSSTNAATRAMLREEIIKKYILTLDAGSDTIQEAEELSERYLREGNVTEIEVFFGGPAASPYVRLESYSLEGLLSAGVDFYNITDRG